MGDTAEQVIAFTEYAVRFADGRLSSPMNRREALSRVVAYNQVVGSPSYTAELVARTVTPWRLAREREAR
jgi:hypothetical protein